MKYRKERRTGVLDVTEQLLERDSLGIFYKNGGMMNGREFPRGFQPGIAPGSTRVTNTSLQF